MNIEVRELKVSQEKTANFLEFWNSLDFALPTIVWLQRSKANYKIAAFKNLIGFPFGRNHLVPGSLDYSKILFRKKSL